MNAPFWIWIVLSGAIFVVLFLIIYPWSLRVAAPAAADKILEDVRATYAPRHEYRAASPADFPWLDLAFYDRTAAELAALGFTHLGDIEDVTLSTVNPNMRTFIRAMTASDGTITAGIYEVKLRGPSSLWQWLGLIAKIQTIDFETVLKDGRWIATTNSASGSAIESPPEILTEYLTRRCRN